MANAVFSNKRTWRVIGLVAVAVLAAAAVAVRTAFPGWFGSAVQWKEENHLLLVGNSRYEIAFRSDNGAISYIRDKEKEKPITIGNRAGALWWGFLKDDSSLNSAESSRFSYEWSGSKGELVFHYGGDLKVNATIRFTGDNLIRMSAEVSNGTGKPVKSFQFPYELKVEAGQVTDGLLPMLPGARLKDLFFKENNSFADQYPGVMFASYAAMRTANGNMAVYDGVAKTNATVNVGFKNQVDDAGKTAFVHNFSTWIAPKAVWRTPEIVLDIGGDYKHSIAGYGRLNGIDGYRSLKDKLGEGLSAYAALPFYKMDISALKGASWNALMSEYVDRLNYNGVLHLVGFQTGGHDENYPDFIPPNPKWGGDAAFQAFVAHAKGKGNKIVPYTNFSWWGVHSPTIAGLTADALQKSVVQKENGTIIKEDYGPHSGYVMNMNQPFVRQRVDQEHKKLLDAGFDGIFEDQWGIRNAPYLYNPVTAEGVDPSIAYFKGVRDYFDSVKYPLYTEDGIDVQADHAVGFMGTNYLWDILGYRKKTASYTDYYPMIGMLARDKVMLYQHDLAAETMTDNVHMLRWNLAMGYNLGVDLSKGVDNPWVDVAGVFQKYVLSAHVDAKVLDFKQVNLAVTRTVFGTHDVLANWDSEKPYQADADTTIEAGGFEVKSADGLTRAGSYVRYNGLDLDPGDHVLAELREAGRVRVFQPFGSDTTLRVAKPDGWPHAIAAAYAADGEKLADLPVLEDGSFLKFDYIANIQKKKTAYVELSKSNAPSTVSDVPFRKVKLEVNLALGKDIQSSSYAREDLLAKAAVDGDPYTYWESAKRFPQDITLDLGEKRKVTRIVLRLPPLDAWERREQAVEVSGSADGQTFSVLVPSQPYAFDPKAGNRVEIKLAKPEDVRFVKLTITSNTAWTAAQLSEFEVYGE